MNWLKENAILVYGLLLSFLVIVLLTCLFLLTVKEARAQDPDFSPLPPPDYNVCLSDDARAWLDFIYDGEPDFSPPIPPELGGVRVWNLCDYVRYALDIRTRGSHAILIEGEYEHAGIIDRSIADYGFAAVGEYREGGIFTNGSIVLSGSPKVKIWFDKECDCIRANRPIVD